MIEEEREPHIQWSHIDGPLLHCRDGSLHWLTLLERLWLRIGITTIDQLESMLNKTNSQYSDVVSDGGKDPR